MTQENKVTFGLENVHIAPVKTLAEDGVITYGDVFRFPGAMELTLDTKGETTPIKADNKDYHFMNSNEGYEGKLKIPHIIDEFATKILGEIKDPQTGVMTEKADASLTEFAMMFEFAGDKNKTRYVMYYCFASRPSLGSKTKNGTSTNERELSFKASPRPLDTVVKRSITSADNKDAYDNWFKKVYEPTAVAG